MKNIIHKILFVFLLCVSSQYVAAHPHVFIEPSFNFVFDDIGLKQIECDWMYNAFASSSMYNKYDVDADGTLKDEKTYDLYESLVDDNFFTTIKINDQILELPELNDIKANVISNNLHFYFTLPLRVKYSNDIHRISFSQYDKDCYNFFYYEEGCCRLTTPDGITAKVKIELDEEIGTDAMLEKYNVSLSFSPTNISTNEPLQQKTEAQESIITSQSADNGKPAERNEIARKGGFINWIVQQQKKILNLMERNLSSTKGTFNKGLLFLCLLAFGYGVLHAAGPGHGKVVTASWLACEKRKLSSGVVLGSLLALFHGLSGIIIVLAGIFLMKQTAMVTVGQVDKPMKIISFSLIMLLGLAIAGMELLKILGLRSPKEHKEIDLDLEKTNGSWKKLILIALAAGIVPCPGVILVMLFASSLGHTALGVVLALCLTLGMAMTISLIGVGSVALRRLMEKSSKFNPVIAKRFEAVTKIGGGMIVFTLGLLFLSAALAM